MAIISLAMGKSPGPDGLLAVFYKAYTELLTPRLQALYADALDRRRLPDSLGEALLVSLPKSDRDPRQFSSYRPLAMLNTDYKILAKVLADRLAPLVPNLVHPDQNGFVLARNTSLNLRRLHRVMEHAPARWPNAGCLVLDMERAFDSIEWPYLFATLASYGLDGNFLHSVKLLCTNPSARVKTGALLSEAIPINRGTRQGCPLSPLLFSLAVDPLTHKLRQAGEEWGITLGDGLHAISLYADDLLLYVRDVNEIQHSLAYILRTFALFSGLRINWAKICLYNIQS